MRKPTRKQIAFVNEYLSTNNATQSAIKAGYKPLNAHSVAARLLAKPQVKELVTKGQATLARASEVTFQYKIDKLQQILEKCLASDPTQHAAAIKAIEVLNIMQGHVAPAQSQHINIDTTLERLAQARRQYKNY